MAEKLLEIQNLSTSFKTEKGWLRAIDGVSFSVAPGELVGLVGESGCGKSVAMQSVMRLYEERGRRVLYSGSVKFDGRELLSLSQSQMRAVRGRDIAMIFQDALSALDPVFPVEFQIDEALKLHTDLSEPQRRARVIELLKLAGINEPERRAKQYPHEISGGMRQRVMIAIALSCSPRLLIADEPTTALNVTIQAQIIDLLRELNRKLGMSLILITHDMSVVAQLCSRVIVMYLGQVVEEADVCSLFDTPLHPYTRGLIRSIPPMTAEKPERLFQIDGSVPLLSQIPKGCRFAPRCPLAQPLCHETMPELCGSGGHLVRCHRAGKAV
jgi:oligopeptide/dipeptide ABC transporter ATP-binding protein